MSFTVIIPARFASTRLPGKPLADLAGKPLIQHVVDRANESEAERVIVATDDERIGEALGDSECEVVMTAATHVSGSDRLNEVVTTLSIPDQQIVVNVQGDEPTIPARLINEVGQTLAASAGSVMATAAQPIQNEQDYLNPNIVKVVTDQTGRALYFSRAPIPHYREPKQTPIALHHIGIYAYRAEFLKRYTLLKPSALEQAENLEQLRVMDNGETIMVRQIDYEAGIGVDTPEDLERAREVIQSWAW